MSSKGKKWSEETKTKMRLAQLGKKMSEETKIGTIEKKYGVDFGTRSDAKLGNFLEKKGYSSLSELLKKDGKKRYSKS